MIEPLLNALVESKNGAADDVLLEALALGNAAEKSAVLAALLKRKTVRGLGGVVGSYDQLPEPLQVIVLQNIKIFYPALRESGRSSDVERRKSALRLVALGRQGKLAYILSENLHDSDEDLAKAAVDALVGLARWVATETRRLQRGMPVGPSAAGDDLDTPQNSPVSDPAAPDDDPINREAQEEGARIYRELSEQRPEIEQSVARALDVHRGKYGQEILRAGLLLCDWPGSRTLAILQTAKHGGQSPMVRRLQQPPASEHIEAFLLGASHGQLRSHFGAVFSHIEEAPVLDALLRKTYWLKDNQLQLCMHQVSRGSWFGDVELAHDIERRGSGDAARIGEWIAVSGLHDVVQDERLERLRRHATEGDDAFAARLRLLSVVMRRPVRGSSVELIKQFLNDPDERLVRMAAREIVRRKPKDIENVLLQLMTNAPESVRRVVSRSIGQTGFEQFWQRFSRLDGPTRRGAGKAMLKMLPDSVARLRRKLLSGPIDQRIKAMQITQELNLGETLRPVLLQLSNDPNPRLRSKAIAVLGEIEEASPDTLLDRALQDGDPRVRANAIEVVESKSLTEYIPLLSQRSRASHSRERANAIKAMHQLKVKDAANALLGMLRDDRPEHRISAMWAMRRMGGWQLVGEIGRLAKEDTNLRVRRYALGLLRVIAENMRAQQQSQGQAG